MRLRFFAAFFIAICFVLSAPAQNSNSSSSNGSTSTATPAPTPSPQEVVAASQKAKDASAAATAVEQALPGYGALVLNAARYQKAIADITGSTTARPQAPIEDVRTLQATVLAVQQIDLVNAMTKAMAELDPNGGATKLEGKRKAVCDLLNDIKSPQQDVVDAIKACAKAKSDAADQSGLLKTQSDALNSALATIYSYFSRQFTLYSPKLDPLATMAAGNPDPSTLLQKLAPGLQAMRGVSENLDEYQSTWNSIKPVLAAWKIADPKADPSGNPAADTQLKDLKEKKIYKILPKLSAWFEVITASLTASASSLDGMLTAVGTDPAKNNAGALQSVSDRSSDVSNAQAIVNAWISMVGFLKDQEPSDFILKTTRSDVDALQKAINALRASISRLSDATAGDASTFETAQVSLYYFFDIPRLMQALNGNVRTIGGAAEAQQAATDQRKALTQAELDLGDAQATVNRYQKQVLDLQEQQRQLRQKLAGQNSSLSKLSNKLQNAQDAKKGSDDDLAAAQQASDADKSGAADRAKAKQTQAAGKLSQAQSDYDAAKADRDNTQAQLDGSQNQSDSLPAKLSSAQQALSDAQTAVSAQRRKMIVAAQAESDAFAFARDNAPFLYAPADAASTDPAKRVILYAFNDSKTIFMRGKPADLDRVKRIIAEFDKPAPQARLTLWTFQLNSVAGREDQLSGFSDKKKIQNAALRLNRAMEIIDEELGDTRARENTALTLLRELINNSVRKSAADYAKSPEYKNLGALLNGWSQDDKEKLQRVSFYDNQVLTQLGFNLAYPDLKLLRNLIPDPAGTTTLGEALLVLSLAPYDVREAVKLGFENNIESRLGDLRPAISNNLPAAKRQSWDKLSLVDVPQNAQLDLTWHALGVWEQKQQVRTTSGLTASQLEITRALVSAFLSRESKRAIDTLKGFSTEIDDINSRLNGLNITVAEMENRGKDKLKDQAKRDRLDQLQKKAMLTEAETDERNRLALEAIKQLPVDDQTFYPGYREDLLRLPIQRDRVKLRAADYLQQLPLYLLQQEDRVRYFPPSVLQYSARTVFESNAKLPDLQETLEALTLAESKILQSSGLSTASPRVAAADEMLKSLIIALEDDLGREFVQPMIRRLRFRLISEAGVNVGIVQRESMLATNRGKARIDPRASAQLSVGTEQDILTGVQQLAQLYATVQSGGALGVIGALQQQPREPAPEIYALTTGDKFEVTPIFDPSGQALRFKFDFVSTTNLKDPNGSTSAQLPRVERHTINTEVQLSNLETREISRFESNARLGRPTEYSGGVPVLKDIPYVRPYIPLIGWFVRKSGSNAVAQQSVIFGQTTIYPTIGALIDLVTDSGLQLHTN